MRLSSWSAFAVASCVLCMAARGDDAPRSAPATQATSAAPAKPIALPTLADASPTEYPGLHNVVAYGDGFVSGSVPEGDEGFASLEALGIKTVISVDGALPEIGRAKAHGLRYVHLPIGYNGFDEKRKAELVRAVRDLPRPIYIHCHHGKHRSAGAAGTIAVSLGWLTNDAAVERMKVSGTAPNYSGLYACTQSAGLLQTAVVDAASAEFPETSRTSGMVQAMVEIDDVIEHLKLVEKAGWKAPSEHPDLVPAAEAGRLADLLRNLGADADIAKRPAEFSTLLAQKAVLAQTLEDLLVSPSVDAAKVSEHFKLVSASCKECHRTYRD